jgi:hypothetical protein
MKKDYLWDKTGSDESVEKLENALRVFRHDSDTAFVVPAGPTSGKWGFFTGFRPLVFAAASIAIAAIGWGAWVQESGFKAMPDEAFVAGPLIESPTPPVDRFEPGLEPDHAPDASIIKTAYRPRPAKRTARTVIRTKPAEARKPEFTKEEIYAYGQLVLALSITSDKLGQVREKAIGENNNIEEK